MFLAPRRLIFIGFSDLGTKYDLDFKSPNRSGQNFKSAEDMINMYKELCTGMPVTYTSLS